MLFQCYILVSWNGTLRSENGGVSDIVLYCNNAAYIYIYIYIYIYMKFQFLQSDG